MQQAFKSALYHLYFYKGSSDTTSWHLYLKNVDVNTNDLRMGYSPNIKAVVNTELFLWGFGSAQSPPRRSWKFSYRKHEMDFSRGDVLLERECKGAVLKC